MRRRSRFERAGIGGQDSERHRQVERRTFLARIGRREVDRDFAIGKLVARIVDRRLDPLVGFAHRALGQADHPEARYAAADIDLDLDRKGIDPGKRAGKYAGDTRYCTPPMLHCCPQRLNGDVKYTSDRSTLRNSALLPTAERDW